MALQNSLIPRRQPAEQDLRPAPARNLTNTDIQRIQAALDRSVSANTRAMYASAWRSFQARGSLAAPGRRLPVPPSRGAPPLGVLNDPTNNEGVKPVMQGISRAHGRAQSQARPLTAGALAAIRAPQSRRSLGPDGKRQESAERASWRGWMDVGLLSVLGDGLLRRSEAAALTWADVELRDNGPALL